MKIMITGAYGMLGSDLREVLKNFEFLRIWTLLMKRK